MPCLSHLFGGCFIIIVQTCPSPSLSCFWPILWKNAHLLQHQFFLEQNCPILMVCTMRSIVGCGVVRIRWSRIILLMKIEKIGTYGHAAIPQIHRLIIIFWHIPHCNTINIAIAITWGRPLTFPWFSRDFISWWVFHNLSIDPLIRYMKSNLRGENMVAFSDGWLEHARFFTGFWWSNLTCSPFPMDWWENLHRKASIFPHRNWKPSMFPMFL